MSTQSGVILPGQNSTTHTNGGLQLKSQPDNNKEEDTLENSIMQALNARDNKSKEYNTTPPSSSTSQAQTNNLGVPAGIFPVGNETPREKRKQIKNLQDALSARDAEVETLQKKLQELTDTKQQELPQTTPSRKDVKLTWGGRGKAPLAMDLGSCTSDGKTAYFRPGGTNEIYSYTSQNTMVEWEQLPSHPRLYNFSLVSIQGVLTAVGGWHTASSSSALFSLTGKLNYRKWEEVYPAMPTPRCLVAVVSNGRTLVVAGGYETGKPSTVVEVMDIASKQWFITNHLPIPLYVISATICEDNFYIAGVSSPQNGAGLFCSMRDLVKYSRPIQKETLLKRKWSQSELTHIWNETAKLPVAYSTCTSIDDHLVTIGGLKRDGNFSNGVFLYSVEDDSWSLISHMPTARSRCLVTVVNGNKLVVVGGCVDGKDSDVVEFASF